MVVITRDRYVVFKLISLDEMLISLQQLKIDIWDEYKRLYGINGTTDAGLFFDNYDEQKKIGIIRCDNKALQKLLVVLSRISKTDKTDIIIIPSYTTGLINKAKKHMNIN